MLTLHNIWLQRYNICHESTCRITLIEDYELLKGKVEKIFLLYDKLSSPLLEQHKGQLHSMTSEKLMLLLHEYFVLLQYHYSSRVLSNFTQS